MGWGGVGQINVVVMRGVNEEEVGDFAEMTRLRAVNVRFIEFMPFDGNVWKAEKMVTYKEMREAVVRGVGGGWGWVGMGGYSL